MNNLSSVSIERVNTATIIRKGINSLLFSYDTLVAAFIGGVEYRTSKKYSATTTKQINAYGIGSDASVLSPSELIELSKDL